MLAVPGWPSGRPWAGWPAGQLCQAGQAEPAEPTEPAEPAEPTVDLLLTFDRSKL